jgi:hypothetical protein
MVPKAGFEPARVAPPPPQDGVVRPLTCTIDWSTSTSDVFITSPILMGRGHEFTVCREISIPYSVKAAGDARHRPPQPFEVTDCDFKFASKVTDCDLKESASSAVSRNMKSSGNRSAFRLTAWLSAFVGTSYSFARSASIITRWPRIVRIRVSIRSAGRGMAFLSGCAWGAKGAFSFPKSAIVCKCKASKSLKSMNLLRNVV